ncbi:MAG: hypothetical protein AAFW83_01540 [Pseudomonadota bacterium]
MYQIGLAPCNFQYQCRRNPMTDELKKSFESAEPASFRDHGGNGEIFSRIEEVERWAKDERLHIAKTVHENRERWLNETRQQVALERQTPSLTLDPPNMPKKPIEQEAQERVSRKVQGLMAEVEAERGRRIEDITQLPHATHTHAPKAVAEKQTREPAHPLKKETHAIVDRAQKVRLRANIHFNKMRSLFIADAEASGSETPVKDVYSNKNQRMKRIDKAEHRLLDKAFKRHGIDRAPKQENTGPKMSG